jgi:arylsulfatase A-like enzyme
MPDRSRIHLALWLALALCAGAGCARPDEPSTSPRREVAVRLSDVLNASTRAVPGGTADYPRATLGDDIRVVLDARPSGAAPPTSRAHASVNVDVPAHARLEIGYGTDGTAAVSFRVTARRWGLPAEVFAATVPQGGGAGWREASVDLGAWAGRVALRFTTSAAIGATAAAYFADPVLTAPAAGAPARGLVLVSLDTLRADHLGLYGYGRATSPNLDRIFSTAGVVVDRVLTQATDTFNGHMALMTGMNPTTALRRRTGQLSRQLDWVTTLAEVLRGRGYRTAAFTEDAMMIAPSGFQRGFEVYHETKAIAAAGAQRGTIEDTFARGLDWLEHHRDDPFFLFLHTYQVHDPYLSPAAYADRFPTPPGASEPQLEIDRYDRAIAYTDEQVRAALERLDALGLADRTLLVVTADHGEEFGEHGGRRHGAHLTSEVLHVPLLFRGAPGLTPGTRRSGPMGLLDVMPTLLGLLGVDTPAQCEGRSMVAHLRTGDAPEPVALFSESHAPYSPTYEGSDPSWEAPGFASTRWPHRLVRLRTPGGARYELYDLDQDPGEHHDLEAEIGASLTEQHARLEAYEASSLGLQNALALRFTGRPEPGAPAAVAVDPAAAAKLKALGYVQ